jgi:hypothetical protein
MSVEVPAKEGQYQHQHAAKVLGHYLQDGGRIMHQYTYTVDIDTFIRRRLRFCKPSVIKGIRLFLRSRGDAGIRCSYRGARQRGAAVGQMVL